MRFALSLDDDLSDFYARFRSDPLIGPAIRRRPWRRPRRRPVAWEALAWAITGQLIEATRAAEIQRRIVRRYGPNVDPASFAGERIRGFAALPGPLRDVPTPEVIAERSPAELAACDLSPGRSLAMIRCAREIAAGRVNPADPADDERLMAIPEIGPWTLECLGLNGRGDPDSLPAGDLAYVKLVGRLNRLGRRATVEEVHEFFRPYEPYRGLAGEMALSHYHLGVPAGPPLRLAA
jgi:3-methyladenine DNA glycosylase/8-oxoguanine DNA glycosylase